MKLRRFHVFLYCPPWARDGVNEFNETLKGVSLKYSYHAKVKLRHWGSKIRSVVRNLVSNLDITQDLYLDYIFEFYANGSNRIKKICYRFPMKDLRYDIILVISSTGKIVTIYLNNNFDAHYSLDESLYEKETINEQCQVTSNNC